MKKIYLSFSFILLFAISNAQLTLTKAFNSPVSGDVHIENYYDSTTAISSVTGTNKVWNYSSVVTSTSQASNTTFTTVSSIPGAAAAFPAATLASFSAPSSSTTAYDMIKSNPTNDETLGSYNPSTASATTTYSNTEIDMTYPFTFGSSFFDVAGYSTSSASQTSTVTINGTGTGTVILPGNITLANCLQVKLNGVLSGTVSGFPINATVTAYSYYHSSQKFAVATVSYSKIDFFSQINDDFSFSINNAVLPVAGVHEIKNNSSFNLFPNPVSEKLTISGSDFPLEIEISIEDMNGRQIKSEKLNTTNQNYVNTGELKKGVYILNVNVNGAVSRRKFIKE